MLPMSISGSRSGLETDWQLGIDEVFVITGYTPRGGLAC